jgi:hypothetical protein
MSNEFTNQQVAVLTREAEREYFAPYYDEANDYDDDEVSGDSEYSWNRYTQTNDPEDWDEQDGTWGSVNESSVGSGYSDTYFDYDNYEYQQSLYY